jgi:hypothetical protein
MVVNSFNVSHNEKLNLCSSFSILTLGQGTLAEEEGSPVSTVDLLAQTSLDQLHTLFTFSQNMLTYSGGQPY